MIEDKYKFRQIISNNIIKGSEDILNFLFNNIENDSFIEKLEKFWEKKVKITFAIMTLNEERCIKRCIESIEGIADEIIVIDTGSTDNTLNIIYENFPHVKVYNHQWQENFSQIRNLFNAYSSNDWIFQLDADEFLDINTHEEIKKMICILDNTPVEPKIISPTLVDHNSSENIYTNRIYKRYENFKYHGIIHEELRFNNSIKIPYIIISNIFFHDGYKQEIIENKQKYKRNVNLLKRMVDLEPNNIRWYYFLARDAWTLDYPKEYIRNILQKGLECAESDYLGFEVGILSKLIELNMESGNSISEYLSRAKQISPGCMDMYYYELVNEQATAVGWLNNVTKDNINKITELDDSYSLINSNGDHLFLSWGWGYFSSRNYDLAFMMWRKIQSDEIILGLNKELANIKDSISKYLDIKDF